MLRAKKKYSGLTNYRERERGDQGPECISLSFAFLCHFCPCLLLILLHFTSLHLSLSQFILSASVSHLQTSHKWAQFLLISHFDWLRHPMGPMGDGMGWDGLGWRKDREGGRSEGGVLFTLQFPCEQGMSKCERKSEWLSERERIKTEKPHSQQAALQTQPREEQN